MPEGAIRAFSDLAVRAAPATGSLPPRRRDPERPPNLGQRSLVLGFVPAVEDVPPLAGGELPGERGTLAQHEGDGDDRDLLALPEIGQQGVLAAVMKGRR